MHALITGSSGQIGTNLGCRLMDEGHSVFGVDIRPNPWTSQFPTLLQDLSDQSHDFSGGIGLAPYPPDIDVVVHLAAFAKVHELVQRPERALHNISMTFNVLEYCRQNKIPFILASTREVYGDIHHYITEESQANFVFTESPYSASKIASEAMVYSYARCYGIRYLIFRFSNVYGRFDNDLERMERVVPLFIRRISQGEPITIFGRHKVLDFTYVDDCVEGVMRGIELLTSGRDENHTINLAYGEGNELSRVADLISTTLGRPADIRFESSRKGEVTRYVADISRARKVLGYSPVTPVEEGIPKAVSWSMDWWSRSSK